MKAILCTKYGPPDVLQLGEVEKPIPKDNEILIKVHATTVSSADYRLRGASFPLLFWLPMRAMMGFTAPRNKILGNEIAGEIEAVGKDVQKFKVGDKIFGYTGFKSGAYAEYKCMKEDGLLEIKPENMTFEEAAATPHGGLAALYFLRKARLHKWQGKEAPKVLIHGASGSMGTSAVQISKHFGAEITGVCSTANVELVKSLGANHVIDYKKEDFTKNGVMYDVIFCTVGKSPFGASLKSLKKNGYYLRAVNLTLSSILRGIWTNLTTSKKVVGGVASEETESLAFLKELFEKGEFKPVIGKRYALEEMVEAHRYADTGHKKGNVVINVVS